MYSALLDIVAVALNALFCYIGMRYTRTLANDTFWEYIISTYVSKQQAVRAITIPYIVLCTRDMTFKNNVDLNHLAIP